MVSAIVSHFLKYFVQITLISLNKYCELNELDSLLLQSMNKFRNQLTKLLKIQVQFSFVVHQTLSSISLKPKVMFVASHPFVSGLNY